MLFLAKEDVADVVAPSTAATVAESVRYAKELNEAAHRLGLEYVAVLVPVKAAVYRHLLAPPLTDTPRVPAITAETERQLLAEGLRVVNLFEPFASLATESARAISTCTGAMIPTGTLLASRWRREPLRQRLPRSAPVANRRIGSSLPSSSSASGARSRDLSPQRDLRCQLWSSGRECDRSGWCRLRGHPPAPIESTSANLASPRLAVRRTSE